MEQGIKLPLKVDKWMLIAWSFSDGVLVLGCKTCNNKTLARWEKWHQNGNV